MDATMKVQTQIRQNAEEVSSYLSSLSTWQKSIKKKDQDLRARPPTASSAAAPAAPAAAPTGPRSTAAAHGPAVRKGAGTVPTVALASSGGGASESAAKHTYDVGYKKWETFDVDAALAAAGEEEEEAQALGQQGGGHEMTTFATRPPAPPSRPEPTELTPTSMIPAAAVASAAASSVSVPAARGVFVNADAEAAERELGNKEFANGNFAAAVKSYTKCLGLKGRNYIAFSNRAMAYLKLKEYHRAESDCSSALSLCPTHAKSLLRRATARNALGKHRAALADLLAAQDADPANKQTRGEIQRTKEALLAAVNRAPLVRVLVEDEVGDGGGGVAGPDLPA